jgi:hypothetical protein
MDIGQHKDAAKSSAELFLASFEGDADDDASWDAVRALRQRNTDEVFLLASAYCCSAEPRQRARALDVLAQLGAGRPRNPLRNSSIDASSPKQSEEIDVCCDQHATLVTIVANRWMMEMAVERAQSIGSAYNGRVDHWIIIDVGRHDARCWAREDEL